MHDHEQHGTSKLNPASIVDPTHPGFDARFSNEGMLGKASYFAEAAAYSDSYAYNTGRGAEKQMYVVRLAAGNVFDIAETQMPPGADVQASPA